MIPSCCLTSLGDTQLHYSTPTHTYMYTMVPPMVGHTYTYRKRLSTTGTYILLIDWSLCNATQFPKQAAKQVLGQDTDAIASCIWLLSYDLALALHYLYDILVQSSYERVKVTDDITTTTTKATTYPFNQNLNIHNISKSNLYLSLLCQSLKSN